jgi:sec-independent protein translocase protein TatB
VFGFSFGEFLVLLIVGMVVLGPKELPKVLRKLGQWSGRLRRMASELRAQSGIDEVLREGDMGENIAELRKLARGELDVVKRATTIEARSPAALAALPAVAAGAARDPYLDPGIVVSRDREYPREGADSYRALPDGALVFANTLPESPLAKDALYVTGDRDGVLPEPAPDSPPAVADPHPDPSSPEPTSP